MKNRKIYRGVEITLAVIICALVVICGFVLSKYVHQKVLSGSVSISASLGDVAVKEHEAVPDGHGSYTLGATEVTENTYGVVLPGLDIPKDPFVKVENKSKIPAYVYVEVVDGKLKEAKITYTIADSWKLLEGVTGKNGGLVYVYVSGDAPVKVASDISSIQILENNTLYVSDALDRTQVDLSLKFYASLGECSATVLADGISAAADVYKKLINP